MTDEEIDQLKKRISALEDENRMLRARLEDLSINYPVVCFNGFIPHLPVERQNRRLPPLA